MVHPRYAGRPTWYDFDDDCVADGEDDDGDNYVDANDKNEDGTDGLMPFS